MNSIEKIFIETEIEQIKRDLDKLALPFPQYQMNVAGYGCCTSFLSDYGLVVRFERIEDRKKRLSLDIKNPFILQPLHAISNKDYQIEICPGVEVGMDWADGRTLQGKLRKLNIDFWDFQEYNGGWITDFSGKLPRQPVIIDRNAVSILSENTRKAARGLIKNDLQKQFKPLRDAFAKAAFRGYKPDKLRDTYLLCKEFKAQGKLICGWEPLSSYDNKTAMVQKAAQLYRDPVRSHHQKILGISP